VLILSWQQTATLLIFLQAEALHQAIIYDLAAIMIIKHVIICIFQPQDFRPYRKM
jgi:hypothetical protein